MHNEMKIRLPQPLGAMHSWLAQLNEDQVANALWEQYTVGMRSLQAGRIHITSAAQFTKAASRGQSLEGHHRHHHHQKQQNNIKKQ